jgi:hypothetical protein
MTAMTTNCQPWHRQLGEPVPAYRRFLVYLNLGFGRSLCGAYLEYRIRQRKAMKGKQRRENAQKGAKRQQKIRPKIPVPGQWCRDAARWNWRERATEKDIHTLLRQGERATSRIINDVA